MITGRLARGALRDERKKSGCTQQQIADLLGIDRSTYSYYENGRLQVPQSVLLKLADYYKMPVSMFFSESSDHVVFRSDVSLHGAREPGSAGSGSERSDQGENASVLTFEEKRLLSQLRARSCYCDDADLYAAISPMEYDDDALLSYLVDPDDL